MIGLWAHDSKIGDGILTRGCAPKDSQEFLGASIMTVGSGSIKTLINHVAAFYRPTRGIEHWSKSRHSVSV